MSDIRDLYKTHFDGIKYAKEYIIGDYYEKKWVIEDLYHRVFSQGKVSGKTLIEVGNGPAMRSALTASGYVSEIYLADLLECNREIVTKWLNKAPDALDYSVEFKHVADLEGKDDTKYLEERVRKRVKEVMFCDLLADNPLAPRPLLQYDIVASTYCLDSFPDINDYHKAWRNIAALTRPEGYVIFVGTLEGTKFIIGGKWFPGTNLKEAMVKTAVKQAGLELLEYEEFMFKTKTEMFTHWKGAFTVLARKC